MWLCVDPLQDGKLPASVLRKDNIFNAVSVNVIAGAAANGKYLVPLWPQDGQQMMSFPLSVLQRSFSSYLPVPV